MKRKLFYFLGQNGYLKMMTTLPEYTIFFTRELGFLSVIEIVDLSKNPYATKEEIEGVIQKVHWKFLDQGVEELHHLTLLLSDDVERANALYEADSFCWVIDTNTEELVVPQGRVEDFYGLYGQVQTWIHSDIPEEMSANESGSYDVSGRKTRSFLEQPLVNHGLFVINAIVYTLSVLTAHAMVPFLDLHIEKCLSGEWYRVLTSMFMHVDASHLFSNLLMLLMLGDIVERELGHRKYAILYFASGIFGAAASLYYQYYCLTSGQIVHGSIGASGAIFGVEGALLCMLIKNKGKMAGLTLPRVLFLVCYTFYQGVVTENIDNAAHFGGLLAGFVVCIFLYRMRKTGESRKETENIEN